MIYMKPSEIIIASDHPDIANGLEKQLRDKGWKVQRLPSAADLSKVDISEKYIILDTNEDVALLKNIVDTFYERYGSKYALPMIALFSETTLINNPQLSLWNVNGHEALAGGVTGPRSDEILARIVASLDDTYLWDIKENQIPED